MHWMPCFLFLFFFLVFFLTHINLTFYFLSDFELFVFPKKQFTIIKTKQNKKPNADKEFSSVFKERQNTFGILELGRYGAKLNNSIVNWY